MITVNQLVSRETLGVSLDGGGRSIHVVRRDGRLCRKHDRAVMFTRPPSQPTELTIGYLCQHCLDKLWHEERNPVDGIVWRTPAYGEQSWLLEQGTMRGEYQDTEFAICSGSDPDGNVVYRAFVQIAGDHLVVTKTPTTRESCRAACASWSDRPCGNPA